MRFLLLVMVVLAVPGVVMARSLQDQLALAESDGDQLAQIELIRRILGSGPDDAAMREKLTSLWMEVGDYDEAESVLKAWTTVPEAFRAAAMATILVERDGDIAGAIGLLEEAREKFPDDLTLTRQLAAAFARSDQTAKAIALLDQAPGVNKNAPLLVERAILRRADNQFAGAVKDFAAARALDSEDDAVTTNLASFERLEAVLPKINRLAKALATKPNDYSLLVSQAAAYLATGFGAKAAAEYAETAMKSDPGGALARLYFALGAHGVGTLTYADALSRYGVNTAKPPPPTGAFDALLKADLALAKSPNDPSLMVERAFLLNGPPEQFAMALQDADAAVALRPDDAPATVERIYSLLRLNRIDDAQAAFRQLEAMNPPVASLAVAIGYMIDADLAAYKLDSALALANRAIALRPDSEAFKRRAAILTRLGRSAEAERDLASAKKSR